MKIIKQLIAKTLGGAKVMEGKIKGVQASLKKVCTYCYCYQMKLVFKIHVNKIRKVMNF